MVGLTDTEVQAGLGKPSAGTWFVWAAVSSVWGASLCDR